MQNNTFSDTDDTAVKPVVFSDIDKVEPADSGQAHQAVQDIRFSAPVSATPTR